MINNHNVYKYAAPFTLASVLLAACSNDKTPFYAAESKEVQVEAGVIPANTNIRFTPVVDEDKSTARTNVCLTTEEDILFPNSKGLENSRDAANGPFIGFEAHNLPKELAKCADPMGYIWIAGSQVDAAITTGS